MESQEPTLPPTTTTIEKKEDWAEMSDGDGDNDNNEEGKEEESKTEKINIIRQQKKKVPQPMKGQKNQRGDYIVTTIDIPDTRTKNKIDQNEKEDDSSDSDTESDEEDEVQEQPKPEESTPEAKPSKVK